MKCTCPIHTPDPQRRLLLQGMAAGIATTLLPAGKLFAANFRPPQPLPAGQSVYRIKGKAWVNGNPVDATTRIVAGDTVKTGMHSELVFAVGNHAMLLRSGSHLVIEGAEKKTADSPLINLLRLFSGKLLSASRNPGMQIHTPGATIGIRGTGVYLETGPEKTFFCTCYGEVDIASSSDPTSKDTVKSSHHDKPLFVLDNAPSGKGVRNAHDPEFPAPKRPNHTDDELILLEALVGRTPPFVKQAG